MAKYLKILYSEVLRSRKEINKMQAG